MPTRGFLVPALALLVAAAGWGSTVVVAKSAFDAISPVNLVVSRLVLTGLVLLVAFQRYLRMPSPTAKRGAALGLVFGSGLMLQTVGLEHTPPSLSGFVTASYVVFTALIAAFWFRQRQPVTVWMAVVLTLIGISILAAGHGRPDLGFGFGTVLTLAGAVLFALHIVLLGRWVRPDNVKQLTLAQSLAGAAAALAIAPFSGWSLPQEPTLWWQILYLGIFCGAVTLFLQSWAQSHVPATPSAVIMCTEPVFAAAFAIGFGMESFTVFILVGGSLVVTALLLTAWPRKQGRRLEALLEELRHRAQTGRSR